MTKIFDRRRFMSMTDDSSGDSGREQKYAFVPLSKEAIDEYFDTIANTSLSAMTPVRTAICITLDLSGSMCRFSESIRFLFKCLTDKLMSVGRSARQYTLIIMVIHNSEPKVGYIGDANQFDCKAFVDSLPTPHGDTPLAKSFCMADNILKTLNDTLEKYKHWYTVPVFFTITDCGENGKGEDLIAATERYTKDIQDGKKLFIEFVTGSNPNGLNLGGYKVPIDGRDSKLKIEHFVDALSGATSSDVRMDNPSEIRRPPKDRRKEFNQYYSDIMLFNFKMCFERSNTDVFGEEDE